MPYKERPVPRFHTLSSRNIAQRSPSLEKGENVDESKNLEKKKNPVIQSEQLFHNMSHHVKLNVSCGVI